MICLTQNSAFGNILPPKWKLWISNGVICLSSVFSLLFYFLIHYFHLGNLSLWLSYQCYRSKSFLLFGSEVFNIRQFKWFCVYWPPIWESCKMYCEIKCSKIMSTFIWCCFFFFFSSPETQQLRLLRGWWKTGKAAKSSKPGPWGRGQERG